MRGVWLGATAALLIVVGCGATHSAHYEDAGADGGTDADLGPSCLDEPPSGEQWAEQTDDYELPCTEDVSWWTPGRPDVAVRWTAPERGFYEFSGQEVLDVWQARGDSESPMALMLLDGDCGGGMVLCCLGNMATDDGSRTHAVLEMEEGQTLTLVAEFREPGEYFVLELFVGRRLECPSHGELQHSAAVRFGDSAQRSAHTEILHPSCSPSPCGEEQATFLFAAPERGRYRFSGSWSVAGSPHVLALWSGDCHGEELACARGDPDAEIDVVLERDQHVVVGLSGHSSESRYDAAVRVEPL